MTHPPAVQDALKKLTETQRRLILADVTDHFAVDDAARQGTRAAVDLMRAGLIHAQLSPLGLAVQSALRQAIMEQENGNG